MLPRDDGQSLGTNLYLYVSSAIVTEVEDCNIASGIHNEYHCGGLNLNQTIGGFDRCSFVRIKEEIPVIKSKEMLVLLSKLRSFCRTG